MNFKNFYAIHDCFATTANYLDSLSNNLKAVYFNIYSNKAYLLSFDKGIREYIKLQYGNKVFESNDYIIKINDLKIDFPNIHEIIGISKDSIQNNSLYENMLKSSYTIT